MVLLTIYEKIKEIAIQKATGFGVHVISIFIRQALFIGFGLAYSRQFFGNQIIPFIDFDWRPDRWWHVYGQFPVKPRIEYSLFQIILHGL
ncbi:hypothetical protein F1649_12100 [Arcticibacter tournemirensis]|uniref:Uncharacterized protein n=1 Tax=Arcticibacter tournemirensis TaxID=699437 RepID=A0A5M9H8C2_9SPHI|nr:hypothetical protein [Arcticibacter tournemirensis]KAA8482445.1 hypothetical protein F1649_12100 [Arcticibacter tournemirensis]